MSDQQNTVRAILQKQLAELDAIEKEATTQSMNTIRGAEFVQAWKARTVALIAQHVGPQAATRLADAKSGPSFTNDLFEEFSDEVEIYRAAVRAAIKDAQ
mgnify:CR=1 FL=1